MLLFPAALPSVWSANQQWSALNWFSVAHVATWSKGEKKQLNQTIKQNQTKYWVQSPQKEVSLEQHGYGCLEILPIACFWLPNGMWESWLWNHGIIVVENKPFRITNSNHWEWPSTIFSSQEAPQKQHWRNCPKTQHWQKKLIKLPQICNLLPWASSAHPYPPVGILPECFPCILCFLPQTQYVFHRWNRRHCWVNHCQY